VLGDEYALSGTHARRSRGGGDLVFPHHECEIAQAEPVTGCSPFARVWLHTAMVEHEGAKMSKSLGNLVMVRNLLKHWSPDALRLYLGQHHYRLKWNHDPDQLVTQHSSRRSCAPRSRYQGARRSAARGRSEADFTAAMDDDLSTRRRSARSHP
jgi:cysteinyl-tRNA synthetase